MPNFMLAAKRILGNITMFLKEDFVYQEEEHIRARHAQEKQFQSLAKKLSDLEKQSQSLAKKFSGLVEQNIKQKEQIRNLRESTPYHNEQIQPRSTKHIKQDEKIENLSKSNSKIGEQISHLTQQATELSNQVAMLSKENLFFFKTSFSQDQWLAQAKDIHKGERCFLLGSGPSLNKVDLSRLHQEWTMGVNGTFLLNSLQLDYFVTVSHLFWKQYTEELKEYCCKRRFLPRYLNMLEADCPTSWLTTIERKDHVRVEEACPWFFSTQADRYVVLGGTVIGVCLQILYHLGFSEVILLGIDHNYGLKRESLDKRGSWVGTEKISDYYFMPNYYPKGGETFINIVAVDRAFQLSLEAYQTVGRKLVNASPGTMLDIIPKVDYNSLF